MSDEDQLRGQAMFSEIVKQRNAALDQCAMLGAEVQILRMRLAELEKKPEDQKTACDTDGR